MVTATQDIRLELIQHEYSGMRSAVHTLMDRMDGYESAVLGLTEAVSENSKRISALEAVVMENRELMLANQQRLDRVEQRLDRVEQRLASIESKLDRLMAHLDVPPKPPAGFVKE